ncbi:uncharacterized protein [Diabrotica undecimpunctata]|uniref:uncharacterized protein n=1 Tax=Diabrotica undecimpunctata TaxID=50387 RepID=UPI003B63D8B9
MPNSVQTTSNYISLEMAEKMLIKYDGDRNKVHEFIDNCTMALSLVDQSNKNLLFIIIKSKICGKARMLIKNRDFQNWTSLKNHLLDGYTDKRTEGQWQLELHSCRQNQTESVMSFANRVEDCYVKLLSTISEPDELKRTVHTEILQNQALNVFLLGLNKEIALVVKARKPTTLENAISIALTEEQELKSKSEIFKYQNIGNSNPKYCHNCNKNGHTSQHCRLKIQSSSSSSNSNNRYQNKYSFQSQPSTSYQSQNFQRQSIRHTDYTPNTKICNYCKKLGHLIHECRER